MDRRSFLKAGMTGAGAFFLPSIAYTKINNSLGHVVIIGVGFGGATVARYLRMWSGGKISVTVIEPRPKFVSCPVSNRIFSGNAEIKTITHG